MRLATFVFAMFLCGASFGAQVCYEVPDPEPTPPPAEGDQLAAFAADMVSGEWREIPNTKMSELAPTNSPYWQDIKGNVGQKSVQLAWGGAAWSGSKMYSWGGGHGDYGGNEVYAFNAYSLTWARETEPSPPYYQTDPLEDGRPCAKHSFDSLEVVAGNLYVMGQYCYPATGGTSNLWAYSSSENEWSMGPDMGYAARVSATDGSKYYAASRFALKSYTPSSGVWEDVVQLNYHQTKSTMEYVPSKNWLLIGGNESPTGYYNTNGEPYKLHKIDLSDNNIEKLTLTGCEAIKGAYPGIAYANGAVYIWSGGQAVDVLNVDTMTCSQINGAGFDPGPAMPQGTHGKWRYLPTYGVFMLLNGAKENVIIFKG